MRFERELEGQAALATTGRSNSGISDIYAVIESKPRPEVELFQRGRPKEQQTVKHFLRENRMEVTAFARVHGKGTQCHYPLRFINRHQIEVALSLSPGDKIRIIRGEISNKHGRRATELHVRQFALCDH
jgi:hypothetical protein